MEARQDHRVCPHEDVHPSGQSQEQGQTYRVLEEARAARQKLPGVDGTNHGSSLQAIEFTDAIVTDNSGQQFLSGKATNAVTVAYSNSTTCCCQVALCDSLLVLGELSGWSNEGLGWDLQT